MRKIEKKAEPESWAKFKKKYPNIHYAELRQQTGGSETSRKLREHLVKEQYGLCAYCCREISLEDSLNEHIRPQSIPKYQKETMDYQNLVASCDDRETCGHKKGNQYDEKMFVSPLEDDCKKHFAFYANGEIEGTTERGQYTCDLLGLNSYKLQRARRACFSICVAYHDEQVVQEIFLTPKEGKLKSFADMISYFLERGEFSVLG